MLFHPHWKLDGSRVAASPWIAKSGTRRSHSCQQHIDFQPGQVVADAEVLAAAERQRPTDGPVPDELVGLRVLPLVAVGRREQGDDALARLDGLVVNGEGPARRSGEPLRRRAVADHLLARDRHVGGGVGAHRGHLVGPLAELPQPVGDDLGHRLRATDEDAQHLGRDLDVGQRAAVGQPVAEQAVDNRQRIPGLRRPGGARPPVSGIPDSWAGLARCRRPRRARPGCRR